MNAGFPPVYVPGNNVIVKTLKFGTGGHFADAEENTIQTVRSRPVIRGTFFFFMVTLPVEQKLLRNDQTCINI